MPGVLTTVSSAVLVGFGVFILFGNSLASLSIAVGFGIAVNGLLDAITPK